MEEEEESTTKREEKRERRKKRRRGEGKEEKKRRRGGKHGTWIRWWTVGSGLHTSKVCRYLPTHASGPSCCHLARPCRVAGPGSTKLLHQHPLVLCTHPPAREDGPPRGDGAELGGGRLRNCACCGEKSRRWGSEPKRGTAEQRGASEGKDGGAGGGIRRSVSRPYAGACDQPLVAEVARAACLGGVAEP